MAKDENKDSLNKDKDKKSNEIIEKEEKSKKDILSSSKNKELKDSNIDSKSSKDEKSYTKILEIIKPKKVSSENLDKPKSETKVPKVVVVTRTSIESHKDDPELKDLGQPETKIEKDTNKEVANKIRNIELQYITKTLRSNRKQIALTILFGMVISFTVTYFINAAGIFQLGIAGISQGFSYMVVEIFDTSATASELQSIQIITYWTIYLTLNIPIIIFTYLKFNSKFFILTITIIITNIFFGFMWVMIPGLTDITFILDGFISMGPNGEATGEALAIVVLATIAGVIFGLLAGATFKNGGSTGGADPISRQLSRTKGINIGTFNIIFTTFLILIFTVLNDFILEEVEVNQSKDAEMFFQAIFSPVVISSAIFIAISSLVLDRVFPTKKTLSISINTEFGETLSNEFNKKEWSRGHNFHEIKGGKSKQSRYIISMIINSRELPSLIEFVHRVDKNCLITTQPIDGTYGNYDRKEKTIDNEVIERKNYRKKIQEEHRLKREKSEKLKKEKSEKLKKERLESHKHNNKK